MTGMSPSDSDLATGWWEYGRLSDGSRAERKWLETNPRSAPSLAWEEVQHRMSQGGAAALDTVLALIDRAPQDADLSAVGAGPLEDLVHEHGLALAGDIDRFARTHAGFRVALQSVYVDHARLGEDAGERLARWIPGAAEVPPPRHRRSSRR